MGYQSESGGMFARYLFGIPYNETTTNGGLESLDALNEAWAAFAKAQPSDDAAGGSGGELAGIWAALSSDQRAELVRLFANGLKGCSVPALDGLTRRSEAEARSHLPPFRKYLWIDWGWGGGRVMGGTCTVSLNAALHPESGEFAQWKVVKSTLLTNLGT